MRLFTRLIAVALTATMTLSASANERELHIEQGQFVLTADGARLPTSDIAGTEVVIGDPAKGGYRVRINGQIDDPHASQPMRLYDVDFKNRNTTSDRHPSKFAMIL